MDDLLTEIRACRICAEHLAHGPRPIIQAAGKARLLIIGQAPGTKVHASGKPWADASGERLREWLQVDETVFYDPDRIALMPMGLCFPGTGESGDLPPRPECAPQWHSRVIAALGEVRLTILVGQYAHARYLPAKPKRSMTEHVRGLASTPPGYFTLPHPSWRSTIWMRRNPWFETDVLPELRRKVAEAII